MTDNDEEPSEEVAADEDEAVKSGDISILNSLVGHGSPRSFQLLGKLVIPGCMYSLIMEAHTTLSSSLYSPIIIVHY